MMQIVIDIDDMAHDWLVNGFPDEDDMEMALRAIKNGTSLPTGHWIFHEIKDTMRWYECDQCGAEAVKKYDYCHGCGAKMESE